VVTSYVALLRAVNVGGTGKLPMNELKAICIELGFGDVRTFIASGNVVFTSRNSETAIKSGLQKRLQTYAKRPVEVFVRSATEMAQVATENPFPDKATNRTVVIFLDRAPPKDTPTTVRGQRDEEIRLGHREIYVHYPSGMGKSKLVISAAEGGTARNMNTVSTLAKMAAEG
jgi:uncharacterized protein (DUF1697 family)